jgi:hypothetical protein
MSINTLHKGDDDDDDDDDNNKLLLLLLLLLLLFVNENGTPLLELVMCFIDYFVYLKFNDVTNDE